MCSVNDIEGDAFMERKPKTVSLDKCMKCEKKAIVLIRARDPICRTCFLHYFNHKFRATLGKSKAIRQGEKALIAFSGGSSSCCLLNLIHDGLSENVHKKLRFIPQVVFLDESAILDWTEAKTKTISGDVQTFCGKLGLELDCISLEQLFSQGSEGRSCSQEISDHCSDEKSTISSKTNCPKEILKECFRNVKSLTAKQDLLHCLRSRLLGIHAKEKGCTKIIVAETSTSLSIKLLSNIAQGRGGSLPFDVAVNDSRDDEIRVIRPMRELTSKEVAFYNRLSNIEPIVTEGLDTKVAQNASLQRQTEAFVTNLQADFPSTVSTIFRTGDKLTLNEELKSTEETCVMCQTPIVDNGSSSVHANKTKIENVNPDTNKGSCCGKGDGGCEKSKTVHVRIHKDDVIARLCYGCRLTFKDMGYNVELLPAFVIEELQKFFRRSQMKECIQDFLLE
eukprot:Seg1755.4 transcript_id=Seg1755.4/GoldUCD/mRNA.D3Y31 product="Cytoplasmic tRNA 2-thiolation protein 2-B" protein_id=Seg1755.4/GoldUCD/D3Y31